MEELAGATEVVEFEVGVVIPAHGLEGDVLVKTSPTATPAKATTATTITTIFVHCRRFLTAFSGERLASSAPDRRMARGNRRSVRARSRVELGTADLVDRPVGDREVDFVCRGARLLRTQAEAPEQGLGHSVMPLVLLQGAISLVRDSALSAESRNQAELLERSEVGERGRGAHPESRSDVLETRAASVDLSDCDDPESLDLPMGQLLEGLHVVRQKPSIYIVHPNY
jgi:hypothetical protein